MKNLTIISILCVFFISKIQAQCPDNIENQADIDLFKNNNCTQITGSVTIDGTFTSLEGLANLTTVDGSVYILDATNLQSLSGLEHLQTIGADLKIKNSNFTSFSSLSSLQSVGLNIDIDGNQNLNNLGWNIASFDNIYIQNNRSLSMLDGFSSLTAANGIYIGLNNNLSSVSAINSSFESINVVSIFDNYSLTNLDGFNNIKQISELYITGNHSLTSVSGFNHLENIDLLSISNTSLTDLDGFSSLQSINGEISIQNNLDLAQCAIRAVCTLLKSDPSYVNITNNKSGSLCESNTEAQTACTVAALPVELLYFNGKIISDNIQLSWASATEINNSYFDVEHSTDGKSFTSIGRVMGHGTTSEIHRYSFTDINPTKNIHYYRLKQVDTDNRFAYSPIISLTYQPKDITIYPNPTNALIHINTEGVHGNIELKDSMGKLVLTQNFEESTTLNLTSLPNNFYFLSIKTDNQIITKKILKE